MEEAIKTFEPEDQRPIKVFFQDESRFGRISQRVKCWAPKGVRPEVAQQIVRQFLYCYSAVSPWDGENFSLLYSHVDGVSMGSFLEEFSNYYKDYRNIMIMDGAGWHSDSIVNEFENIRIIKQPPYSPELNPAEHLWDHIKENYFRNKIWKTLNELNDELCRVLRILYNDKNTVQSLTGFDWIICHSW